MSESSSRRIISRHKITNEEETKHRSDYKLSNAQQNQPNQKTKEAETIQSSQLVTTQTINYLNKEPFNEDLSVEESYLSEECVEWKSLVLDKLRIIIDTLKNYQNKPVENVKLFLEKCLIQ